MLARKNGESAAWNDALLNGSACGRKRVLDAVLLLLQLDLGSGAHLDDGDTAGELGQAFLELLAVEVGSGLIDLCLDLVDAARDVVFAAGAVYERGLFLGSDDSAGASQIFNGDRVELASHFLADDLAAGEDGHVLEHCLAAVAEAGEP